MNHATFKAGTYWIGDPCYAVRNDNWDKVIEETYCFGNQPLSDGSYPRFYGIFYYHAKKCFAGNTKYGDGEYYDNYGNSYGVDAGLLGIFPYNVVDGESRSGGRIFTFEKDFEVTWEDGFFKFGHVAIETDDLIEDDDLDDDKEW